MPKLVISLLGLTVVVLGVFLLADRLGGRMLGADTTPASQLTASPSPSVANLSTPRDVAAAFVNAWNADNYSRMYDLLSTGAKANISRDDFVKRYEGIAEEIGQASIQVTLGDASQGALRVPMRVVRQSSKVGKLEEDNTIPIVQDPEQGYRVDWTPSLIFADLGDGFVRWIPDMPQRGRILDRKGRPLANLGSIAKVGVVPGQIKDEQAMLQKLSQLLAMPADLIKQKYQSGQPDWFMPIANLPFPLDGKLQQELAGIPGVEVQQWPDRVYPAGPAAAQIVGYLSQVTAEELPKLSKEGYSTGDMIGRAGLEAWGEQYLRGKPGGRLVIVGPDGTERKVLGDVKVQPADDIITTIDLDVQMAADKALGDKAGSVVVLDPNTGAILAMVSHPSFDPNKFILGMSQQDWAQVNNQQTQPLLNRATQMAYPTGSTFKVVTTTAAMTQLGMTPQTTIPCPGSFSLPGSTQVWRDWSLTGQGTLTLHNALVQSCDTVMYQIGADLDKKDPNLLPNMAKAFGFGSPTGIPELPEVAGVVPDPQWKLKTLNDYWARGDAVNLAIGQGYFLATPLQLADAYAAIANGGTLWQPYLVQEVVGLNGAKVYTHQPKERGKLPASAAQLAAIRSALKDVVNAPNGTAAGFSRTKPFQGDPYQSQIAGKTGTAESGQAQPHAWFTAFSPVDGAKLAVVAMVEYGGEGGDVAAPIDRQVIDAYYAANP